MTSRRPLALLTLLAGALLALLLARRLLQTGEPDAPASGARSTRGAPGETQLSPIEDESSGERQTAEASSAAGTTTAGGDPQHASLRFKVQDDLGEPVQEDIYLITPDTGELRTQWFEDEKFVFDGLDAGAYGVRVVAPGFEMHEQALRLAQGEACVLPDITLQRRSRKVSGTLEDEFGRALDAGILISYPPKGEGIAIGSTGQDGAFEMNVRAGWLIVDRHAFARQYVRLDALGDIEDLLVVMKPGAVVRFAASAPAEEGHDHATIRDTGGRVMKSHVLDGTPLRLARGTYTVESDSTGSARQPFTVQSLSDQTVRYH